MPRISKRMVWTRSTGLTLPHDAVLTLLAAG
jgi:hypothetical protein